MWLKIVGLKKEDVTNPTLPMIFGFIANFIQALGLALIFIPLGIITPCWGMTAGLFIGIVFLVSNMLSEYLFHNLSMKHLSITGGYRLVSFLIMGAIIGLWQ